MKLEEMGLINRKIKIADSSPDHPGEVGKVVTHDLDRVYCEFEGGNKVWIPNKHVVGTHKETHEGFEEGQEYPLMEMAAKKTCESCGKTMAANHYWYKGGWKCKGVSDRSKARAEKAKTEERTVHSKTDAKYHVTDAGAKRGLEDVFKKQ